MMDIYMDTPRIGIQELGVLCYPCTTLFIGREDG